MITRLILNVIKYFDIDRIAGKSPNKNITNNNVHLHYEYVDICVPIYGKLYKTVVKFNCSFTSRLRYGCRVIMPIIKDDIKLKVSLTAILLPTVNVTFITSVNFT